MSVAKRFNDFLNNIKLTKAQLDDGASKCQNVIKALNDSYWNSTSGTLNSRYIGSWAKHTHIRPPRDVDVLFELPFSTYTRYQERTGNKQSQLLQEVRQVLGKKFSSTYIKGDGPSVLVGFHSFNIEIIPTFLLKSGKHSICLTNNGGSYKVEDYSAQFQAIRQSNNQTNNNTRHLIRMMKKWQSHCTVPLKSFFIELTVIDFLKTWGNAGQSYIYYDFMVRDYLRYLISKQNTYVTAPGTYEMMYLGSNWVTRAETAIARARKACDYETNEQWLAAGDEWQKIFGTDIPKYV